MSNNIECPECGSTQINHNCIEFNPDTLEIIKGFMYTCRKCNEHFNLPKLLEKLAQKQ